MAILLQDISTDETTNDAIVDAGDFKIGLSDKAHIIAIIQTYHGHWKEYPFVGVGIDYYRASGGLQSALKREMALQLGVDGYTVNGIQVTKDDKYYIDCERKQDTKL